MAYGDVEIVFSQPVPDAVINTEPEPQQAPAMAPNFGGATAMNAQNNPGLAKVLDAPEPIVVAQPEPAKRPSLQSTVEEPIEDRAALTGDTLKHSSPGIFAECFGTLCEATENTISGGVGEGIQMAHAQEMTPEAPKADAKPEGQTMTADAAAAEANVLWQQRAALEANNTMTLKPPGS